MQIKFVFMKTAALMPLQKDAIDLDHLKSALFLNNQSIHRVYKTPWLHETRMGNDHEQLVQIQVRSYPFQVLDMWHHKIITCFEC